MEHRGCARQMMRQLMPIWVVWGWHTWRITNPGSPQLSTVCRLWYPRWPHTTVGADYNPWRYGCCLMLWCGLWADLCAFVGGLLLLSMIVSACEASRDGGCFMCRCGFWIDLCACAGGMVLLHKVVYICDASSELISVYDASSEFSSSILWVEWCACVAGQSHCRREHKLLMPPVVMVARRFWQRKLDQLLFMCGRVGFIEQDSTSLWCLQRVRMLYVVVWIMVRFMCMCGQGCVVPLGSM